jgi:hypothetical protein
VKSPLNAHAASWPQKIVPSAGGGPTLVDDARANHWPNDGQSLRPDAAVLSGFSVHADGVAHGMKTVSNIPINYINSEVYENEILMAGGNVFDTGNVCQPTIPSALDFAKGNEGEEFMLHKGEGIPTMDDRNMVGIAWP